MVPFHASHGLLILQVKQCILRKSPTASYPIPLNDGLLQITSAHFPRWMSLDYQQGQCGKMQEEEPLAKGHFVATKRFDEHLVITKSWLRDNHFASKTNVNKCNFKIHHSVMFLPNSFNNWKKLTIVLLSMLDNCAAWCICNATTS